MIAIGSLLADLEAEHDALDERVAVIGDAAWEMPTPAPDWSVRDQISHLCFFDEQATLALEDPRGFAATAATSAAAAIGGADVGLGRALGPAGVLERWRASRAGLLRVASDEPESGRVPWFALPMSLPSFVTARLMETWAHGQDVADALGLPPVLSDRLAHLCHLGVAARAYSFQAHGLKDPGGPLRVEVRLPSGATWGSGPPDAHNRVTGSALDLAQVVTRRRHRADTDLSATGALAEQWLAVAQAFAGPPGPGRAPGMGQTASGPGAAPLARPEDQEAR
jgi:uncharacterized protein (TIGR03084 family)